MLLFVAFRKDEDVIYVRNDGNIKEISEQVINTALLRC
jgi:hypothetical protein